MNPVRPWVYTYILKCYKTNTFYTGTTNNLGRRVSQHNKGQVYHTSQRLPEELIYFEACLNKEDAYRRERYLKSGMGKRFIKNRLKKGLTG